MNVGQYRILLGDLEIKRAEVIQVHDNGAHGYAKAVLANARVKIESEIADLMSLELMPIPTVVSIRSAVSTLTKLVGETEQLVITAVMSDGSIKDLTKSRYVYATFKDYDLAYNNTGAMTSVSASQYVGAAEKFRVVKTSTGWNVYNESGTDGLQAIAALDPNTYDLADINGTLLGIRFVTDGAEVKGDNWSISANVNVTGTTYETDNEAVFGVDDNGMVFAVGAGTATLTVRNNGQAIAIPITVA